MATKTLRVFAEYTSTGFVPMPTLGNIDYGYTLGSTFPATTPSSFQTDNPDIDVTVTAMTDFYVWIRINGQAWNPSYTRNVRVYPDSPNINNVVVNMIIATGPAGVSSYTQIIQTSNRLYFNGATSGTIYDAKFAGKTYIGELNFGTAPGLATVATSGAYADLTGKPTLATVATSGLFTDLSSKPSGTAPLSYNSGTNSFVITQANTSTNGYVSSTDWNNFNSKTSNTGTVTSVALSVPTGLSVSGSPITTTGTFGITLTAGYVIPTTTSATQWDSAYSNRVSSLTVTGSSGASTLVANVLNIPTYTLAGLGGITATFLSGASGVSYNSTTGVITYSGTVYTDASIRALLSGSTGITYNSSTGAISYSGTVYTDASVRALISASGSVSYNATTGVVSLSGGNLTEATSSVLTITGGTGAVIGGGTSIQVKQATTSISGFLSSTDWTTFNTKQSTVSLTTTGTSGAATFSANTLNIPNYGSALSGYLPLSGGTLTGALSGTSATFSGVLTISTGAANSATNFSKKSIISNGGFAPGYGFGTIYSLLAGYDTSIYATDIGHYYDGTGYGLKLSTNDNTSGDPIERLSIASTGAATFSGTITANGGNILSSGASYGIVQVKGSGASTWQMFANPSDEMRFGRSGVGDYLTIANTGAATFSSSVTATGFFATTGCNFATTSGNIGIGTASPSGGFGTTSTGTLLDIFDGTSIGGNGGALVLSALSNNSRKVNLGQIRTLLTNGTPSAETGDMVFSTMSAATLTERMRITSAGNVGIGTSNIPNTGEKVAILHNDVNTLVLQNSNVSDTGRSRTVYQFTNSSSILTYSGFIEGGGTSSNSGYLAFQTNNAGTPAERMRIAANGNIGIGTTTTTELVNLNSGSGSCFIEMNGGTSSQTGFILKRAGTAKFQWVLNNDDSLNAYNYMSGTNALRLTSGGNTVLSGASDNGYRLYVNGTIYATGNITANSDLTLKKNLTIIDNPIDKLMQLNGYAYQWKANDEYQYGVIAQEVEKVLPYAVQTGNDKIKGVAYNQLTPLLIEGFKSHESEITILKARVKYLESKLA